MFFINHGYDLGWNYYGLRPGYISGLIGIITMPFLHGNFEHLLSNSIPLLLSMAFIVMYFPDKKWQIMLAITGLTGLLLWFMGDVNTNHIGASGLVYGFISFVFIHALINWHKETIAASFVLIFLYSGIIYGIFPEYGRLIGKNISWEGHLSGAISGLLFAFIFRNFGPKQKEYFQDEFDDDDDDVFFNKEWFEHEDMRIRYLYREKPDEDED